MECSDSENDANKNGTKHADLLDEQSQQRSSGNNSTNLGNDGKVAKRRRSDDFDYLQRNDLAPKDSKDIFARVPRTDTIAKDGE